MTPLDLTPYLIRHGDRVTASRVESERARRSHAKRRHAQFLSDPIIREAGRA